MALTNSQEELRELFNLPRYVCFFFNVERLCEQKLSKTEYSKKFLVMLIIKAKIYSLA